jgi:erythromycin esterase
VTDHSNRLRVRLVTLCGVALFGIGCLDESLIQQPELAVIPGVPPGWSGTANTSGIGTTIDNARSGKNAAYLSNGFQTTFDAFRLVQTIRADDYRGKRVRLTAWVRPRNVSSVATSGIWMRVDGPGVTLAIDEMRQRPVFGFGDWRQVSIVLDVAERAVGISFGALFQATNTLLLDDMALEVVATTVATTNTLVSPTPSGLDSLSTLEAYARSPRAPVNLDFEGLAPIEPASSAWIAQTATSLSTDDPGAALGEMEPLRAMIGTAHTVGLGDATYGSRESSRLKHRLARFLVSQMGFTTLVLEAPFAEAEDLNAYVNGGAGSPERLLSRLYSWTTNTQELAEVITWLREWNRAAPLAQRVQLRGMDIVAPGASMDSVASFIRRVAPAFDVDVQVWYQCLAVFRNQGATPGRPRSEYAAIPAQSRALCAEGINDAVNLVVARGGSAAGSQTALQHARQVQQFEALASLGNAATASRLRDSAMATNVVALREQPGTSRVMVWSHNDRITRQTGAMGGFLLTRFGVDYRPIGMAFATGRFNALLQQGASTGAVQSHQVIAAPLRSIEETFLGATSPRLLLDMRRIAQGGASAAPLAGPIAMRTIGVGFNPNTPNAFTAAKLFPADFDVLLFFRESTPTTLLPFVN